MRDDFAVLVLSHGRPETVETLHTLRLAGYTGRWYVVIDSEDETGDEYRRRFGADNVIVFAKALVPPFDVFDNRPGRGAVVWARNATWQIARDLGLRYFAVYDDDYTAWSYRRIGRKPGAEATGYHGWKIISMDRILGAMVAFLEATPALTICMSQGGDHMGGIESPNAKHARLRRKAMNSFICDVSRPFTFVGRINEDVTTYVTLGALGQLLLTYTPLQLEQYATQTNPGGLTDLYLDIGTYQKTMYTVIAAPSCVTVRTMGRESRRFHHHVNWRYAVPKIIREDVRRTAA